jgi:hypothetical protein
MTETPKILKAQALKDRRIEINYENNSHYFFNFESYFEYTGYYAFLSNLNHFLNLQVDSNGNHVFWINEEGEEIEIDPIIMHSICTQKKVIIDNKIVFDPALKKNAWL